MGDPEPRPSHRRRCGARATRRDFLKLSALGMAAAAVGGITRAAASRAGRGNAFPGRILLSRDPAMHGQGVIDKDRVAAVVHQGVRILTGVTDTAAAFESLLPGLHADSRIAIKVNCIGATDTRWETTRGVVAGLALMRDGTYDISQVTIYDNRNFVDRPSNRFRASDFTFNGHCPIFDDSRDNCSDYYVYGDHRLTQHVIDCDYLVNMPALKCHNRPVNQLTLGLKNHYGSCCPSDLCDDVPGMLTLNADPHIREKTALVLMDGLRGTYDGPPEQAPQVWQTFTEGTPNLLFFSTDPVTNEYWGRELINTERIARGLAPKSATWIEAASEPPYALGVSDPAAMEIVRHDPAGLPDGGVARGGSFLLAVTPNPTRDAATLRLRLAAPGPASLTIQDAAGRRVRDLGTHALASGSTNLVWDGRGEGGARLPAGVYFARLATAAGVDTHRILRVD